MVKLPKSVRTYTLGEIELRLRSDGFTGKEAKKVVTSLEPKPITIQQASERYGLPQSTIRWWLQREYLHEIAPRIRCPARGGGKVVIDEAELEYLLANPPKVGRPRNKTNHQ